MSWINKYAQSSFSVKILMSLVIFLIFLIISSIIIVAITALCENYMSYVELLRLNLSVQSLGLFVIPPFFVSLLFSNHPFKYLQISCAPSLIGLKQCTYPNHWLGLSPGCVRAKRLLKQ